MAMRVLNKLEVIERVKNYVGHFETKTLAAEAIGCTPSQISNALADKGAVAPAILQAIGVERKAVYVVDYEDRFSDGSTVL
jgi:hypothetical protein